MRILILTLTLGVVLGTTTFARSDHFSCSSVTDEINKLMKNYPGSEVVAYYAEADTPAYLDLVNSHTPTQGQPTPLIGEKVVVIVNKVHPDALVLVFHEGCFGGAKTVARKMHVQWHQMIVGPGT